MPLPIHPPLLDTGANPMDTSVENDPRWQLLQDLKKRKIQNHTDPNTPVHSGEPASTPTFIYAVKTTGIYCRPGCPARLPKPQNIDFYTTSAEAEQAGYRPCQRCKPEQIQNPSSETAQLIARLCRYMETAEQFPSLEQLAEYAGLSPHHLHRLFKNITGLTPKAYAIAHRAERLRQQLKSSPSITTALYEAGYQSSARFYENAKHHLGMTPSHYQQGGPDTAIRFAIGQCSLGAILVAQSPYGICAIALGDDATILAHQLQDQFPAATLIGDDPQFQTLVAQVVGFIEAPHIGLDLPLDLRGTAFQHRVWQALQNIPPGTTLTYTQLAQRIGAPKSARAVARACAANRIAVAIPCHRIIRTDGSLSGYRWGVDRKQALLTREANVSTDDGQLSKTKLP